MLTTYQMAEQILLSCVSSFEQREWALSIVKNIHINSNDCDPNPEATILEYKKHPCGLTYAQIGHLSQITYLDHNGNPIPSKIFMIKQVREWTKLPLKDSKEMVENLFPFYWKVRE